MDATTSFFKDKTRELRDILRKDREVKGAEERLFLLGVEYDGASNKAVMKFYDPEDGKVQHLHDRTGHQPYCLTPLETEEIYQRIDQRKRDINIQEVKRYDLLEDMEKRMRKIVVPTPQDIGGRGGIRKELGKENTYEAWIPYHLNYIYDKELWPSLFYDIKGRKPYLSKVEEKKKELIDLVSEEEKELVKRYLPAFSEKIPKIEFTAMDIEVEGEGKRIARPKSADKPVISISFVTEVPGQNTRENLVFLLQQEGREKGVKDLKETDEGYLEGEIKAKGKNITVRVYQQESQLILDTFLQIAEAPILLTFNGDEYDLHYLYKRAKKFNIKKKYIPFTVTASGRLREAQMKVGIHLDLYKLFRNAAIKTYVFKGKYDKVSLNEVASTLLGKEKIYTGEERFEQLTDLSLKELATYNFYDSVLTAELFKYNNWIPLKILTALSRITRFPIRELSRRGVSAWIENWIKAEHRVQGNLIPNQTRMDKREEWAEEELRGEEEVPGAISRDKKFRGGMVLEPNKGTWFDVYVLDFASLYPSVIKVHNISYETVLCPHTECRDNKLEDLPYWVCEKRTGIISKLVGLIRDVRVEHFKPLSKRTPKGKLTLPDVMQGALKVLINASYGVLGAEHFPFYELFTAESVTSIGRRKIKRITEKAKKMGLDPLYGDTDSIFIHQPSKEEINELIEWSSVALGVDIEVDKVYDFLALSSRKKNYFGVRGDGGTDVKGMMVIKRNTPPFLKQEFRSVKKILKKVRKGNLKEIKERISDKIGEIVKKVENKEYPLNSLAFHTQLTKPIEEYKKTTPQHVKAAKKLKQHGKTVKAGQIISYVKTKTEAGVEPLAFAEPREVDWEKYLEFAESAFDQLLNAFDISFQRIAQEAKGIKRLSDFV